MTAASTLLTIGAILFCAYLVGKAAEWDENRQRRRRIQRLRERRAYLDNLEPQRWTR